MPLADLLHHSPMSFISILSQIDSQIFNSNNYPALRNTLSKQLCQCLSLQLIALIYSCPVSYSFTLNSKLSLQQISLSSCICSLQLFLSSDFRTWIMVFIIHCHRQYCHHHLVRECYHLHKPLSVFWSSTKLCPEIHPVQFRVSGLMISRHS